ncbi:MarR family winged helix-turn-helix transcriptional regulator [Spirochaetota bacterium]
MYEKDAIYYITRVYYKINRYLIKKLASRDIKGFVPSHGEIIGMLFLKEKLQMKELAEMIDKDKSTVTALVKKLVRFGYVKKIRDKDDNRINYISLAKKGEALMPHLNEITNELYEMALSGVNDREKDKLNKMLVKIFNNF